MISPFILFPIKKKLLVSLFIFYRFQINFTSNSNEFKMFRKKIPNITIISFLFIEIISFANALQVTYDPSEIPELFVDDELNVTVSIHIVDVPELETEDDSVSVKAEPESILGASLFPHWNCINYICNATVKFTGRFLGFGKLFVLYKNSSWSR